MTALLLLAALGTVYTRPAITTVPAIEGRRAWVYFTDKGVYNDGQYAAALRLMAADRSAAPRRTALDFDDIPVRESYVRQVEALGARRRTVSRWLNAASFDLGPGQLEAVARLPFVAEVRPVVERTTTEEAVSLGRFARAEDFRGIDTAESHRFYGPSWDQAYMMGVPQVSAMGYSGSGVKLAMFDSGLRLVNKAVTRMRLGPQRDFLSGDNFIQGRAADAWSAVPIDRLRFFGLVNSPALFPVDTAYESGRPVLLAFCADSFAYGYNPPRRMVFAAYTTDNGVNWSTARPIYAARPFDQTVENLAFAGRGEVSYLAFNDLTEVFGPAQSNLYLGWFIGTNWNGAPRFLGTGRWPAMTVVEDTLYLAFCRTDTSLGVIKYAVGGTEPVIYWNVTVPAGQRISHAQVAVGPGGVIDVVCAGAGTGALLRFRSSDGGETYQPAELPVTSGAALLRLAASGSSYLLFYADESATPFTRLSLCRSTDAGATWQVQAGIVDTVHPLADYTVTLEGAQARLLYESQGMLRRTASADLGANWDEPVLVDTSGFVSMPRLCRYPGNELALWCQRGDSTAVWETADTARFSSEQPHHGTRMASIIAGYQPGGVVGVAPGVDLLVVRSELFKVRSGRYYEYNMEEDTYIEALEWAERMGADIVSTSLGYRGWYGDDQFDGRTAPISVAADRATRRGMVLVTAMGNRDTTVYPWPSAYITAPGDAEGVITAGGVEKNYLPWRGTGTGPTSDGRVKPDLVALSDTVAVASPDSVDWLDGSVGTSCATALIAGAAALLKEAHPLWDADSLKAVLYSTASLSVKSCTFGFGVPRVDSVLKLYPPEPDNAPVTGNTISLVFPNPYNPETQDRVWFALNIKEPQTGADIAIYTASGALVRVIELDPSYLPRPGRYGVDGDVAELGRIGSYWDGLNDSGKPCASGLYVAVLRTTFGNHSTRFALVR
jgi:hypothetical protein